MGEKNLKPNSLFICIMITILIGIIIIVSSLSLLNINRSKEVFLENFKESQEKIFSQIDNNFYEFNKDLASIFARVSTSQAYNRYLIDDYEGYLQKRNDIMVMKKLIDNTELLNHGLNLFVMGMNGKRFIYNSSDKFVISPEDLFLEPISKMIMEKPKEINAVYRESGYTTIMSGEPVIVYARGFFDSNTNNLNGIIYVSIKESEFKKKYNNYASNYSDILVFNQYEDFLSSNNFRYYKNADELVMLKEIVKEMEDKNIKSMAKEYKGDINFFQIQKLQNANYKLIGIIKPNVAFNENYRVLDVVVITLIITIAIAAAILQIVRSQTRPLYRLMNKMKKVGEGNFGEPIEIKGSREIQQLSLTYNTMLSEIKEHIEHIYRIEGEKREAELKALQMQINPHYMYNTLASIKWLVLSGNTEKTIDVIDSFIMLLRNTISDNHEFISVEQEIENLKNYVLINEVRYGEEVKVEYYISNKCLNHKIPKLILQPFVENAFFHAFPENRSGKIQVFVKEDGERLRFDIKDNGIGMKEEVFSEIKNKKGKSHHFTGIGIDNVNDRIKMIYGKDYGVEILSEENEGTKVTITLPIDIEKQKKSKL